MLSPLRNVLPALMLLAASTVYIPACFSEEELVESEALETERQPIVGGQIEEGWPGVGAMTTKMAGLGYMGSFCSGTLVAPQWVLTAAHCLSGDLGQKLYPEMVMFFVGANANPTFTGEMPDGQFFNADKFFIHPSYNPNYSTNDIALMHLAAPVTGVPHYQHSEVKFAKDFVGKQALYVGYGVSNGKNRSGGGIKRSGHMKIWNFDLTTYISAYTGSGVCFGDSGGPGFLEFDGEYRVIGINSSVWSQNADPCSGAAVQTRVDTYAKWLNETMTEDPPDCRVDEGLCWCPQGCNEAGWCDNSLCQTQTCGQVYDCWSKCGAGDEQCQIDCYVRAGEPEIADFHNLAWCMQQKCFGSDKDYCAQTKCAKYYEACTITPTGNNTCKQVHACQTNCQADDPACRLNCYHKGSALAQERFDALANCFEWECAAVPEVGFQPDCGWENCAFEVETCLPAANCGILGGDCGVGTACWYSPTMKLDCYRSDGGLEGALCAVVAGETRPCADGLQCVMAASTSECRRICTSKSHCEAEESCVEGEIHQLESYGYCDCVDDDDDGYCDPQECDDSNAAINPAAEEICDDIDNNCDGKVDEGCPGVSDDPDVEVDGDGDGGGSAGGCTAATGSSTGLGVWLLLLLVALLCRPRRSITATRR